MSVKIYIGGRMHIKATYSIGEKLAICIFLLQNTHNIYKKKAVQIYVIWRMHGKNFFPHFYATEQNKTS